MPKYLSGRVKRTPQGSLTTDRYQYLGLEQAEPNLGDPPELDAIPSGTQYQIVSLIDRPGERFWVPIGGGIQPGSVTIRDEGLVVPRTDGNPNLGVSSITDVNFVGAAVTVVGFLNPDGSPGTAVTVTISPPGDNFEILFNSIGGDEFASSPNFIFDNRVGIGSVGIGTVNPTQNLHVVGNVKLDKTIYGEDNQPGNTGNLLVKTATGGVKWTESGAVTSGAGGTITQIQFHDDTGLVGGASNFVFDSTNSRIGIGSTQPDRLLDVLGDSRFTGVTTFSGDVIFAGDNHNITFDKSIDDLIFDDNAKLTFGIGNTTVNLFYKPDTRDFRHEFIGGANYVLLTNTFDLKSADASKAAITAYAPDGVPEVRLFNDGDEKLRTTGDGVTVFGKLETTDIFASGNVGIGTSITPHKLSVKGTISKISGDGSGIQLVNIAQDASNHGTIAINQSGGVERIKLHSSGDSYFNGGDVGIGTTNPTASNIESALESNTKVLAVGILTANQIFGKVTSIQETIDLETLNVSGITSTKNLLVTGIATFDQGVSIGGTLTYEDVTNVDSIGIITARQGIHVGAGLSVVGVSTFNGQVRIANTDLTTNSSADDLVVGTTSGNRGLTIFSGTSNTGNIFFADTDTSGVGNRMGTITYDHSDNYMRFSTSGNQEKVRIDKDGKIGIGTTNPDQKLHVYNEGDVTSFVEAIAGDAVLDLSNSGNGNFSGINFIRERDNNQTGRNGGSIFMPSNTSNNEAFLYIQAQSTNAQAGVAGTLSDNNGVRLKLHGDDGIFSVETGPHERLRVGAGGSVGIGTSIPYGKLHISSGAGANGDCRVYIEADADNSDEGSNPFIIFKNDGGIENASVWCGNTDGGTNDNSLNLSASTDIGGGIRFFTGDTAGGWDTASERLRITSGGNVGINEDNPTSKLHVFERVSNSVGVTTLLTLHSNRNDMASGVLAGGSIRFLNSDDNNSGQAFIQANAPLSYDNDANKEGQRERTVDFNFVQSNANLNTLNTNLTIKGETGNVGIGSDNPDGKLHVFKGSAGNVNADSDANNIVIESNTDPGISFLSPNNEQARIKFADPDDTDVGAITYSHNNDTLSMRAGGVTVIGITSTKTTIEGNLDVDGTITYSTVADVNSVGVVTAQNGLHVTGAGITVVGVATFHDNVDILDLTEDRVVFVGAGRTLTDSSNLTFYEEKEVLSIGGSVGIGTTNPKAQLHIGPKNGDITSHLFLASGNNDYGFKIDTQDYGSQNVPLRIIRTRNNNDSEVIRVTQDGEVGIGTDNPDQKLHVYNGAGDVTSFVEAIAGDALLKLSNTGNGNYSGIDFFRERSSGTGIPGGSIFMKSDTDADKAHLYIQTQSASAQAGVAGTLSDNNGVRLKLHGADGIFSVETGPHERFRIDNNGNVGIGTNNPLQKLDVRGTIGISAITDTSVRTTITSGSTGLFVNHGDNSPTIFQNQGIERFRITKDGDVGIGTDNPTGVKALTNNNNTLAVGILTANQIFGSLQGAIVPDGDLVVDGHLLVTGVSTFVGVATFGNVGIGGSLPDDFLTNKFVVGDGGGSRGMTIYSDGTLGQIYFADGNSGDDRKRGGIVYDHSQNELKFSVNAVEKFVIDSDGDVGIGTSVPTSKFDVHMNAKSGVNFLNISNNSAIDLKSNQVESCGRIQVSESVGGGVMILSTKNTGGTITERLRMHTNGDVTTTGADFSIANAGFTARKDDCVSITRAGGTPLEINRTTDDGELIKFYQDGTEEANISIDGDDLVFGNTSEKFRINSGGAKVTGNLEVTGVLTYEDVTNIDAVGVITAQSGINVTGGGIDVINSTGIRVSGISTFYDNVNFQDRVLIGREVGTAIHGVVGHTDNQLQVVGTGTSCGISIIRYSNDDSGGSLTFAKSKSPTIGTNTAVQNGDELGVIRFNGADQSGAAGDIANSGARIRAQVTGNVTHDDEHDIPTSLFFDTSPDGLASPKERMSIRHDGLVGMGTTTAVGTQSQYSRLIVSGNNDSTSGYGVLTIQAQSSVLHESTIGTLVFADRRGDFANITAFTDDTTGGSDFPGRLSFATTPDGATVPTNKLTILSGGNVGIGSEIPQYKLEVAGTVAATNFDSLSDRKVKTNIQIIQDPIEKIKKIDGVSFNWKSDNKPSLGVIADNVQSVLPEIVSNNDPKSVNYNGLIGLLIEVVKDQQKQIEELRGLIDK